MPLSDCNPNIILFLFFLNAKGRNKKMNSFSRHVADLYMESFPLQSRISSNYNVMIDTLSRSLNVLNYTTEMFVPIGDSLFTFGVKCLDTGDLTKSFYAAEKRDITPESGMTQNFTSVVDFKLLFYALEKAGPYDPLKPQSTFVMEKIIKLPVANGSKYSITDGDGVGGLFLKCGKEFFFSQTFIDCPNNMVCLVCAHGVHRVIFASRHLAEVSAYRDNSANTKKNNIAKFGSTISSIQIAIIPEDGIYIQLCINNKMLTDTERSNGESRVAAVVPLMVYIDMLRWKIEESPETNLDDVDDLFDGLDTLTRMVSNPDLAQNFRNILDNLKMMMQTRMVHREPGGEIESLAHDSYPWLVKGISLKGKNNRKITEDATESALRIQLAKAQIIKEFFPHIQSKTLGSFRDPYSKIGFLKKMVVHGFATMMGLIEPHDQSDLRGQRIKTAEMDVALKSRAIILHFIQSELIHPISIDEKDKRTWVDRNAKKEIAKWKGNDRFNKMIVVGSNGSSKSFEMGTDIRKCFVNYIQKMMMIKNTQTASNEPIKRRMHYTYAGHLCGSDTPSTADVGLELSPNLATMISYDINPYYVQDRLKPLLVPDGAFNVYLNGVHIGLCHDTFRIRQFVRTEIRRERFDEHLPDNVTQSHFHLLPIGVNTKNELVYNQETKAYAFKNAVFIRCDAGRLYKPSLNVPKAKKFLEKNPELLKTAKLYSLIEDGIVEFMDLDEELSDNVVYCSSLWTATLNHTHCDIHPCLIHGTLTSLIPYVKGNHGVKNMNECNHMKATMHKSSLMHPIRLDTISYMAYNLQIPLFRTPAFDWLEMQHRPHGANVIVMLATHCGYNQEDAIVIKKSFIERGAFFGTVNKNFDAKNPNSNALKNRQEHVRVGSHFEPNQKLASYDDKDLRAGLQDSGRVDYIVNTKTRLNVRTYKTQIPCVGDKFSTSHAQKGTVGQVVSELELPYTKDGITPDILLNAHAIPSRTTTAQIVELLIGLAAASSGSHMREYAFDETPLDDIETILKKCGIHENGLVSLIDPMSGNRIKAKMYMGVGYYCKTKHCVSDKVRSQDLLGCQRNPDNHQYQSGRKNDGGIRIGEMERTNIIGYGGSNIVNELFTHLSDGMPLSIDDRTGMLMTNSVDTSTTTNRIESNYCAQKLNHILTSAMIGMTLKTK